jgi:hypothetical protein
VGEDGACALAKTVANRSCNQRTNAGGACFRRGVLMGNRPGYVASEDLDKGRKVSHGVGDMGAQGSVGVRRICAER